MKYENYTVNDSGELNKMERKPISLDKDQFKNEEAYPPFFNADLINDVNIEVAEDLQIVPVFDNSDHFWDMYINNINTIQNALAFISNNFNYISNKQDYLKIFYDASDFCNMMKGKIQNNDRNYIRNDSDTIFYLEQTDLICKYINNIINEQNTQSKAFSQNFSVVTRALTQNNSASQTGQKKKNSYWFFLSVLFFMLYVLVFSLGLGPSQSDILLIFIIIIYAVVFLFRGRIAKGLLRLINYLINKNKTP